MDLSQDDGRQLAPGGSGLDLDGTTDRPIVRYPANRRARFVRSFRALRKVYGWGRLTSYLVPQIQIDDPFLICNHGVYFSGDLSSFIDSKIYLFGEYEGAMIDLFVGKVPERRRRVIFDVGANVGTHSLAFARAFARVDAFEPNSRVWEYFERNIRINDLANVHLHRVALADKNGSAPFFETEGRNFGLGTLSSFPQYGVPLVQAAPVNLVTGDEFGERAQIEIVDAIKIDVQGFEVQALLGLQETLRRSRPVAWVEVGPEAATTYRRSSEFLKLFPYDARIYRFERTFRGFFRGMRLALADTNDLVPGDYVVTPLQPFPPSMKA